MMIDFKKELAEKTAAIDTIVNSYLPEASGEAEYIKFRQVERESAL